MTTLPAQETSRNRRTVSCPQHTAKPVRSLKPIMILVTSSLQQVT